MIEEPRELAGIVRTRLIRLNATLQGVATGLVAGLTLFVATNWLVLKGGPVIGPNLGLLGQFFIGYRVSFVGSLIGFAYASATGFAAGFLVARLYNLFVDLRHRARRRHG
jgi:hypothetical protein